MHIWCSSKYWLRYATYHGEYNRCYILLFTPLDYGFEMNMNVCKCMMRVLRCYAMHVISSVSSLSEIFWDLPNSKINWWCLSRNSNATWLWLEFFVSSLNNRHAMFVRFMCFLMYSKCPPTTSTELLDHFTCRILIRDHHPFHLFVASAGSLYTALIWGFCCCPSARPAVGLTLTANAPNKSAFS